MSHKFTKEDFNSRFYYVKDALPSQVSCVISNSGKKYVLSAGELTTITMIENYRILDFNHIYITEIFMMAYFHDLDDILTRYLPGKVIGKLHRRMAYVYKDWLRRKEAGETCYWHKNSKKYLPLEESQLEQIEKEISTWSDEQIMETFNSDDCELLADHISYVLHLAFDTKNFSLFSFSEEACMNAIEMYG